MSMEEDSDKYKCRKKNRRLDFQSKIKIYQQYHLENFTASSLARQWDISRDAVLGIVRINQFQPHEHVLPIILREKCPAIPIMSVSCKPIIVQESDQTTVSQMEKLLDIWIEDQYQRNIPVTEQLIKAKATELYVIVNHGNPTQEFVADEKWFVWYRHRTGYINLKLPSEPDIDFQTQSSQFPSGLKTLIYHGKYLKDQVFNVDRMLLFWKSMPDGTYISKEAEKMASSRTTLLLGCNASGECKLQPLTIYNSDTLLSVKDIRSSNIHQNKQPNATSALTPGIFEEWFIKDFIPAARFYCRNKNIPFKILLLLDTAPCFRKCLIDLHPKVRVVFLPRIISRKLQPMEQIVKSIFKANYLHLTLNMVTQATQGDTDITVQDFCESYTIQNAVSNITKAWTTIPQRCLKTAWLKICPQFTDLLKYTDREERLLYQSTKRKILTKATSLGFEMDMDDVENLIQSSGSDLTNEDIAIMAQCIEESVTVDLTDEVESEHIPDVSSTDKDCIEIIEDDITEELSEAMAEESTESTHLSEFIHEQIESIEEEFQFDRITVENREFSNFDPTECIDEIKVEEPDSILSENELDPLQEVDVDIVKNEPLVIRDLLQNQNTLDEVNLKEEESQNHLQMTPGVIAEEIELAFDHITCAMEKFENVDPNNARFQAVRSAVNDMLACYREMFEENNTLCPS